MKLFKSAVVVVVAWGVLCSGLSFAAKPARNKRKVATSRSISGTISPANQSKACVVSGVMGGIAVGQVTVSSEADVSCMGSSGGQPCSYSVLQSVWYQSPTGWEVINWYCDDGSLYCNTESTKKCMLMIPGDHEPGNYQYMAGVYAGPCSGSGTLLSYVSKYFTL